MSLVTEYERPRMTTNRLNGAKKVGAASG